jgi:membrane protein
VAASVGSSPLLQWLTGLPLLAPLGSLTAHAAPVLAGTLGFGFLYAFLPNTRVSARAALVAAFASSIVWVAASSGFALVLAYSTQMVAVYAGFSIVLVAILWIWLNWLILLTGVLFAFYLQHPEYLRTGQRDVVATARLADELALSLMVLVARAFAAGNHVTVRRLAQVMDVPSIALQPIADALESAGLLETTSRGRLVPGRDPASLPLDEILLSLRDCPSGRAIALREARTQAGVRQVVRDLDDAIRQSVGAQTLAQLAATPDHDR